MKRGSSGDASWPITQALWLSVCALMAVAYAGCGGRGLFGSGSTQIGGKVVVATVGGSAVTPTSTVVPGATVWLEQQSRGVQVQTPGFPLGVVEAIVENLIQTATADSNGKFQFDIVPQGTYEIVADMASMPGTGTPSNATISIGVQVTSSGAPNSLTIPLVAESGSAALIQGLFTTSPITSQGPTINYAGLQSSGIPSGAAIVLALIPFFSGGSPAAPVISTGPFPGTNCNGVSPLLCPIGTFCACYLIKLPASNPVVGAANSNGTGYSVPVSGQASYSIDAAATVNGTSTADCSPSEWVTTSFSAGSGGTTTAPEVDFSSCS